MKIPKHITIRLGDSRIQFWHTAAAQISLETGIFVEAITKIRDLEVLGPYDAIDEIVFRVMDHEFGSLTDLKKALNNRAFL